MVVKIGERNADMMKYAITVKKNNPNIEESLWVAMCIFYMAFRANYERPLSDEEITRIVRSIK